MNDKAETLNGRAAMIGFIAAIGAYALTGQVIPGIWWMLVLAATLLGGFIIAALLTEDVSDDDDFGGGMMIPASVPNN